MESELEVETRLSERPALEANDTTAITSQQQDELDKHKVGLPLVAELLNQPLPPPCTDIIIMVSQAI